MFVKKLSRGAVFNNEKGIEVQVVNIFHHEDSADCVLEYMEGSKAGSTYKATFAWDEKQGFNLEGCSEYYSG